MAENDLSMASYADTTELTGALRRYLSSDASREPFERLTIAALDRLLREFQSLRSDVDFLRRNDPNDSLNIQKD